MLRSRRQLIYAVVMTLTISGVVAACKKKQDNQATPQFERSAMLKDIAGNVIMPGLDSFVAATETLSATVQQWGSTPLTTADIETAQAQWRRVANAWKVCELFNIGKVQETYVYGTVHTWPVNDAFIEQFISGSSELTEAFIASKGSSSKGIAGIEYLLFGDGTTTGVLDSFSTSARGVRRFSYLKACAANLSTVAIQVRDMWAENVGNYYTDFVSATGTGLSGSINMLVNAMIALDEQLASAKLAHPAGLPSSEIDKTLAEAWRSDESLALIKTGVTVLEAAWHGGADTSYTGIDDNLSALGAKYDDMRLSDKVEEQFALVHQSLAGINGTLNSAVKSDRSHIQIASNELKALLVLLKTDVVSNLSITLTWSDNDGD